MSARDISFVIVNWNTRELILKCIESIFENLKGLSFDVWVVDNASSDGSVEALRERFPDINIIVNDNNLGFARANNKALARIESRYAVVLNPDTIIKAGAFETMVRLMDENPKVAVCGPQQVKPDGTKLVSVRYIHTLATEIFGSSVLKLIAPARYPGGDPVFTKTVELSGYYIGGACMVVRKTAMESVGYMGEEYFLYFEEADWCLRFERAGWRIMHCPEAEVYHYKGASASTVVTRATVETWLSKYRYFRKHSGPFSVALLFVWFTFRFLYGFLRYCAINLFTLFSSSKKRDKLRYNAFMLAWHLLGCPGTWGIEHSSARNSKAP